MSSKLVLAVLATALSSFGANLTGEISDSACGTSHAKMLAEHKNLTTDHDCALACIKAGSKYVLVSEGKVYNIENQTMPTLEQNAGQRVTVTGDVKGGTITISKITPAKKG